MEQATELFLRHEHKIYATMHQNTDPTNKWQSLHLQIICEFYHILDERCVDTINNLHVRYAQLKVDGAANLNK